MIYIVSETAGDVEKLVCVTADTTLVDEFVTQWLESQAGDGLAINL